MLNILFHLFGLLITWGIWIYVATQSLNIITRGSLTIGGILVIIPCVLTGRWLLDRKPTLEQAVRVTMVIHYCIAIFLGTALIAAVSLAGELQQLRFFIQPWVSALVLLAAGAALLFAIFNLVLKGFGAPFAIALTKRIATSWFYAWTRNPLVISALAFLIGVGLWLGSGLFLIWLLIIVSPALLLFLKIYEERELELRFGEAYLEYKARTPMLFPGL